MYQIDLKKPVNVFFCGIGGISMSGIAELLTDFGSKVSGSDRAESSLTKKLSLKGVEVFIGQKASNITENIDVFVYTAAIHKDHPEMMAASGLGLPMLTRAEILGQIMKNYKMPIAVSGTHGKTTVTSMISEILLAADTDPTLFVGGVLDSIDGNLRIGHSDMFVTEACEYTNSFLSFFPKASIILNIEADHLDFFKDIDDIRNSFHTFAGISPADGVVIINGDIDRVERITENIASSVITFGKDANSNYYPSEIGFDRFGAASFVVNAPGFEKESFSLSIPGTHNIYNALAAVAMADYLGIDRAITKKVLSSFKGAKRRFEYKGEVNGITVIDDYAHHPTEIAATLNAAARIPHKALWCVFQPHTYTRTKELLDDFTKALTLSDYVILADIYAARETDNLGISSVTLQKKIKEAGTTCYYFPSFKEIEKFILETCTPGDMLITMGAGDVVNIGNELLKE